MDHYATVCLALAGLVTIRYFVAPFIIAQIKELSDIINDARNTL